MSVFKEYEGINKCATSKEAYAYEIKRLGRVNAELEGQLRRGVLPEIGVSIADCIRNNSELIGIFLLELKELERDGCHNDGIED